MRCHCCNLKNHLILIDVDLIIKDEYVLIRLFLHVNQVNMNAIHSNVNRVKIDC